MTCRQAKIRGLLIGTAVGDALGLPAEGLGPEAIRKLGWSDWKHRFIFGKGMVSDDTEHTLFVAQALLAHSENPDEFKRSLAWKFRWWLLSIPAGIGFGTLRAIIKLWLFVPLDKSGVFTAGNGPAMRSAIIGARFSEDITKIKEYAQSSTELTHSDPRALVGATAISYASAMAISSLKGKKPDGKTFFETLRNLGIASTDMPFIFEEVTADFQKITVQGQTTYRVSEPKKLSEMLNFSLNAKGNDYVSDDPVKLPQRVVNRVQVLMRGEIQSLSLRQALQASDKLVDKVMERLISSEDLLSIGIEVLGLSILAIEPNPETARALEAEVREQLLRESDEATYSRRNAAVEQERAIKENELNTEIAIENKKREIRETQMDAEMAVQEKRRALNEEKMAEKIALEQKNKELVLLAAENMKKEADAKAYGVSATMKAVSNVDPKIVQALTSVGMEPAQLIALAFQELAGSTDKIGQLNVSPDLLQELLRKRRK